MSRRSQVFHYDEVGIVHCVQRCVRRAYLSGKDSASGKNYEYRREWIRRRMELLASVFGLDVLTYAVMSNHLHVILRTRPDVVQGWDDEEIAQRWLRLFPGKRLEDHLGSPTQQDIQVALGDAKKLASWRKRLSDISWFMRALAEPIARKANHEDKCTGRFWEGRFKAQKIADEAGLLACAMYVDLNPIRAAMASSPEQSRFTSAFDRIQARKGVKYRPAILEFMNDQPDEATILNLLRTAQSKGDREEIASLKRQLKRCKQQARKKSPEQHSSKADSRDCWLAPLELMEQSSMESLKHYRGFRASDKGFLPMTVDEYLTLLDWTGKHKKEGKRGAIPDDIAPILERIGVEGSMWCDLVWDYTKYFGRSQAAGHPNSLKRLAANQDLRWIRGQSKVREFFL